MPFWSLKLFDLLFSGFYAKTILQWCNEHTTHCLFRFFVASVTLLGVYSVEGETCIESPTRRTWESRLYMYTSARLAGEIDGWLTVYRLITGRWGGEREVLVGPREKNFLVYRSGNNYYTRLPVPSTSTLLWLWLLLEVRWVDNLGWFRIAEPYRID